MSTPVALLWQIYSRCGYRTCGKYFGVAGKHVGVVLEGEVLDKDDEPIGQQEPMPPLPDIGAVINKALRAAGLLKS